MLGNHSFLTYVRDDKMGGFLAHELEDYLRGVAVSMMTGTDLIG